MFCKNCGRQLDEGENVCPVCGTVNGGETATAPTVEYGYDAINEANEQLKSGMGGQALTWGILSLAFSASGCLSLLGFIFSFIAKSKAKVGRILGKVGFGLGLGMTIYVGIAFFVGLLAGLAEAGLM